MNVKRISPDLLRTRQHFEVLDGMRGVAALSVLVFHFMEVVYTDYSQDFIGHGFLAVDFFFCLSGFVIAYAYDDRIGVMGVKEFFKSRLIRLHPLVISGSVLGLLAFFFDPFGGHPALYSAGRVILIFCCSVLLIPFPVMPDRYFNLFGLNAPAWSLFWEYIANIVYGCILYRIGRRVLILLTVISAAAVCFVAYRSGSIMGGWGGPNFWDGCPRVCFSFLAGMLVYRSAWVIKTRLGFAGMSVLLILAFIMPFSSYNWLTEPVVVILYFPLLIALGAGASLSPLWRKICGFLGKISYPLYMTHYAVLWAFGNYYASHKPGPLQLFYIIGIAAILLTGLSYLIMVIYDMPVRKYLSSKRRQPR